MKKTLLIAATAFAALSAGAQAVEQPGFFDNWSMGLDGGVTTPLRNNAFFGSMRPIVGLHIGKQVTPTFGLGVEGQFGINTSRFNGTGPSTTAFDNSYVGVYGTVDLFNLFGGYKCEMRPFTIEAVGGTGWGHYYVDGPGDFNFFATKAGLNFKFNVSEEVSIGISPYVTWNMNGVPQWQAPTNFNANAANFNLQASVTYNFGGRDFECVTPYNQAEIDALNGQVNQLRSDLEASQNNAANWEAKANGLANELAACMDRPAQVVKEVSNNLNSVRYIFFKLASSTITPDQQPNVEMIAQYMKNHPASKVLIKGYASADGNLDFNIKLAQARAEAVKTALVKGYKIAADRIVAEGEGIGNMFKEESWNRVSICTIEDAQ